MSKETETVDPKTLFLKDLIKVQKELEVVKKSSRNPFFESNYADLNAHLEAAIPVLNANGFVLTQSTTVIQDSVKGSVNLVVTKISHAKSGLAEEAALAVPLTDDMQKLGAAVTYARRYALSSMLAMQAEDDDGETAVGRGKSSNF